MPRDDANSPDVVIEVSALLDSSCAVGIFRPRTGLSAVAALVVGVDSVPLTSSFAGTWLVPNPWCDHEIILLSTLGGQALAWGDSRYHLPLIPIWGVFAGAVAPATRRTAALLRAASYPLPGAPTFGAGLLAIWVNQLLIIDAYSVRYPVAGIVGS